MQEDWIRGSLFCNFKELYHIHQYKFAFVKLFYLFDLFQTRNLVIYKWYYNGGHRDEGSAYGSDKRTAKVREQVVVLVRQSIETKARCCVGHLSPQDLHFRHCWRYLVIPFQSSLTTHFFLSISLIHDLLHLSPLSFFFFGLVKKYKYSLLVKEAFYLCINSFFLIG